MVKMNIFVVVLCVIFFSILNVKTSDGEASKSPSFKPLNIIVILDTSDRVSQKKHPGQVDRDKYIVEEIVKQFQKVVRDHIDQSEDLKYEDRLEIVVPDQPGVDPIPPSIMRKLKIEHPLGREFASLEGSSGIFTDLDNQKKALLDEMPKLFEIVQKHKQTGSDIWEWFQLDAKDYLSADHQNLIVCISDGYLDFDKNIEAERSKGTYMQVEELRDDPDYKEKIHNSKGLLLTEEKDFSRYNVKFLMLEVALRREKTSRVPYQKDFEIIKEYWKTWLKSMGIEDTDFVKQGRPVARKIGSYFNL